VTMFWLGRVLRRPVVCSQANALFRSYRPTVRDAAQEMYERLIGVPLLRRFDGVRVCNSGDLQSLRERGCRSVFLMYPPNTDFSRSVDLAVLSDPYRAMVDQLSADFRLRLLVAGRMTSQKGLDLLAEALLRLARERPTLSNELGVYCAGTTRLPGELARIDRLRPGLVKNLGVLPHEAFVNVMATMDAVLMPSRYESFGRVAAEAQSLGKPVVGTDIPGLREVVVSGVSGTLVKPGSAEAFASAIDALRVVRVSQPGRWTAMQEAARRNFRDHFASERTDRQWDDFAAGLENLVERSAGRAQPG